MIRCRSACITKDAQRVCLRWPSRTEHEKERDSWFNVDARIIRTMKTCLPIINSISTMIRHDIVGVRKEKVILIAPENIGW